MVDGGQVNGDEQPPADAPAPTPLDEQDLQILAAVGLDPSDVSELLRKVLRRLSPRTKRWLLWSVDNWPGRVSFRFANGLRHLQIFDRAMTVGAQLFTSVFPIIIMGASLFGGDRVSNTIDQAGLPPSVTSALDEAVNPVGGWGTFGLVGVVVVLLSATSLSRALTRAYDTIWRHGPTKLPPRGAWRWLAAVTVLALSVVVTHKLVNVFQKVPPQHFWVPVALVAITTAIACYVPWMLMAGRVPARLLLPGALMFAVILAATRPIAERYLATSMGVSAERFGAIGVAFTALAYLYCLSWVVLATAVLGRVIVVDQGPLGRLIRGKWTVGEEDRADAETPSPRPGPLTTASDRAPVARAAETETSPGPHRDWRELLTRRNVVAGVIVVLTLLVVLQNTENGELDLLFFDVTAPRWLWLLGVFLAGFAAGLLVWRQRSRSKAE